MNAKPNALLLLDFLTMLYYYCDDLVLFGLDLHLFQRVADLLISIACFSIPLELLYFLSRSSPFPFRFLFVWFSSFILLCGFTHFFLVVATQRCSFAFWVTLTVLKLCTALVSLVTSLALLRLIPKMLNVMMREDLLRRKTRELGVKVELMRRNEETSQCVRMLTREIRKSLDRHTILYTTIVELARALFLDNCAIWAVDDSGSVATLIHDLSRREDPVSIPVEGSELDILGGDGVKHLGSNSKLGRETGNGLGVAIRLPMLRVSDFGAAKACHAILVLVLPEDEVRIWSPEELELVEVVADQVAVALSHAGIVEDSLMMIEKLMEHNIALHRAREMALMANESMCLAQKVMNLEMVKQSRSIAAILSILQIEKMGSEKQSRIVGHMAKISHVLSVLMEDATGFSGLGDHRLEPKSRVFSLHSMLKDVESISRLLCAFQGLNFEMEVPGKLPDHVIGDQTRILQAVLYMLGIVLCLGDGGSFVLCVSSINSTDTNCLKWKQHTCEDSALLKFEVCRTNSKEYDPCSSEKNHEKHNPETGNPGNFSFNTCEKLAKLMHGTLSIGPSTLGSGRSMNLTIRLPIHPSEGGLIEPRCMDPKTVGCLFKGMKTLLADRDSFNLSITRKLMANLGCHLTVVSSWCQCMETLRLRGSHFHLLLIEQDLLDEDGKQVFARIRKLSLRSWLRVVALTSESDWYIQSRRLHYGIDGVIRKPIILEELEDVLQRVFLPKDGTLFPFLQNPD